MKRVELFWTISSLWIRKAGSGSQIEAAYSSFDHISVLYRRSFMDDGTWEKLRLIKPKVRIALAVMWSMCISHFKLLVIWTPRYLYDATGSNGIPLTKYIGVSVEVRVIPIALHLEMLSSIRQLSHHVAILPRSACRVVTSAPFLISWNTTQSSAKRWIGDETQLGRSLIYIKNNNRPKTERA